MTLLRITDAFECRPDCPICGGSGAVCENHPGHAWGDGIGDIPGQVYEHTDGRVTADPLGRGTCWCGAAGAPCPKVPG